MKINAETTLNVLAKSTALSQDGTKTYYRLTVMQEVEAGIVSVTEDIFKAVETGRAYKFYVQYNDAYKSFSIRSLIGLTEQTASVKK